jgi:hypothetical protein
MSAKARPTFDLKKSLLCGDEEAPIEEVILAWIEAHPGEALWL